MKCSVWIISTQDGGRTSPRYYSILLWRSCGTTSVSLYVELDEIYNLACPASPVHYQFDPVKPPRRLCMVALTCSGSPNASKAKILQASTSEVYGDPQVHLNRKPTGAMSIPLGCGRVMTKGNAVRKPCFLTTTASIRSKSKWRVFLIRTGRICIPRMDASSAISSCRPCREDLTVYGNGNKRAVSVMSTTSLMGSSR